MRAEGVGPDRHVLRLEGAHPGLVGRGGVHEVAEVDGDEVAVVDCELGVEPDEETTRLYEQIKDDKVTEWDDRVADAVLPSLHNLPTSANAFIGRQAELATIENWLLQPNGRLLTIVGAGGMGKTRLAQEAARAQPGAFADGVWYVSLVALTDLNGMVTAVADVVGLTLSGQAAITTQLLNQLKTREMLLILDNLEHLLNADLRDFISQLCRQAPELRVIATSRERLRLQAESLLELDGLPFPANGNPYTVNRDPISDSDFQLMEYAAVQLFVNRVQRIQADFDLGKQETAVSQLCQLVGGLPLALELAATWTRVLSVAEIVAEIQRGLGALTTMLHDVPQRHRSLHAVIESSWRMLPADEQKLFCRLAVFRGGFTRAAAQQVADATLPQLMSLVDRSFLRLDEDQRFRRHPLMLQFALEQLADQPEEQAYVRAAHAQFFTGFVQTHELLLSGADAPVSLAALSADLENIRAAWQYALLSMDEAILNQLVTGIGRFFADRSRYLEGTEFFTESLRIMGEQPSMPLRAQIVAKMQVELGNFLYENGRYAEAVSILKEANQTAHRYNMIQMRLMALRHLGQVISDEGDRDHAKSYYEEALQLCRPRGDEEQKLLLLWRLGILQTDNGAYAAAHKNFAEAMTLAQTLGNKLHIARVHNSIAVIANRRQDYKEAITHWQLAREGFQAWQHGWGLAATSHNLAMAYSGLKQYDAAMENIVAALAAHEKIGHKRGMAGGLAVMASIYRAQGKRREARRYYYDSLRLSQEMGAVWLSLVSLVDVAELEMSYGKLQQAAQLLLFVAQHPAAVAATLENANKLLDELRVELPEGVMGEVETAVSSLTLDAIIANLIAETI